MIGVFAVALSTGEIAGVMSPLLKPRFTSMVPLPDVFAENVPVSVTAPCVNVTVGLVDGIVACGAGNGYCGVGAELGLADAEAEGEVDAEAVALGFVVDGVLVLLPPPHAASASASAKAP